MKRRSFIHGVGAGALALGCEGAADALAPDAGGDGASGDLGTEPDVSGPPPVADAGDAGPAPRKRLTPLRGDGSHPYHYVDTIVMCQMENRSFDHYFGALSLLEGRADVEGLSEGLSNSGSDGTPYPIHALGPRWVFDVDPGHSHGACVEQFGEGKNDGFVRNFETRAGKGPQAGDVMGYHTRAELPAHYHLADNFALFDRWHCSLLAPTWPNRFYSHCATSGGKLKNDKTLNAPTMYPTLEANGLAWELYGATVVNFLMLVESIPVERQTGKTMADFFAAAEAGTLPNVCILEPDVGFADDHPPHDIRNGQAYVASIYEALRRSPKWDRTLFLLFYDEHGGFYDHVPPPKVAFDERPGFDQLGFRIPGLMAGGLVKRGAVIHDVVDHSSLPALIARVFGLPHLNQRSETSGDFANALSLDFVEDELRPVAPEMPVIELLDGEIERAAQRGISQVELWDYAMHRGFVPRDYVEVHNRRRRETLEWMLKLGAVRRSGA